MFRIARKTLIVFVVALLVGSAVHAQDAGVPGAEGIGDPDFPLLGNGGYDVQHYTLDLTADVEANTLDGTVTITAMLTEDLESFNLDFVETYTITQLTVDGTPAEWELSGHELTVTPANTLTAGDTVEIAITYSGSPEPEPGTAIPVDLGWNNYGTGSYVASEPDGAASWYPVNDHPLDKATYTFRITVPEPFVVAANGVLTDTIDNGDTTTYVWEMDDPMASYLATVGIDDFVVQTAEGPDGVQIRNFFPPEVAEEGERLFAPTADMIAFFSETFGPYPFDAYGVYVADVDLPFALETQTMTLFARSWLDFGSGLEEAVAHELAHQWYGNSVSLSEWGDIWLNEGFATYASWLWFEHEGGPEALEETVSQIYEGLAEYSSSGNLLPPGDPSASDLFSVSVYYWGAMTLHALRLQVGDEAFFEILRTYYDRYQHSNATTEDFIAVAEEVSRQDLGAFFDSWLYGDTLPELPSGPVVG
ncbi:MAG: M1 family peptidase [Planctomycetaceae bacterium]|nr:MAG: M1 family peptidase [Planctomycetaceae bacterium]